MPDARAVGGWIMLRSAERTHRQSTTADRICQEIGPKTGTIAGGVEGDSDRRRIRHRNAVLRPGMQRGECRLILNAGASPHRLVSSAHTHTTV